MSYMYILPNENYHENTLKNFQQFCLDQDIFFILNHLLQLFDSNSRMAIIVAKSVD